MYDCMQQLYVVSNIHFCNGLIMILTQIKRLFQACFMTFDIHIYTHNFLIGAVYYIYGLFLQSMYSPSLSVMRPEFYTQCRHVGFYHVATKSDTWVSSGFSGILPHEDHTNTTRVTCANCLHYCAIVVRKTKFKLNLKRRTCSLYNKLYKSKPNIVCIIHETNTTHITYTTE